MREIVKSIESLKRLLKDITNKYRKPLNDWFYNANDEELKNAISLLNSTQITAIYPRQHLKEYTKFAINLLKGELPQPPTDLDLNSDSEVNYYKFAQGSYQLFSVLQTLTQAKLKTLFRKCSLMAVAQKSLFASKSQLVLIRHLASFCRIINSRLSISFKSAFSSFQSLHSLKITKFSFKSKAQNKKLKLKSVREMIKKGRVNLEQRAFWIWKIVYDECTKKKIKSLKDDFSLLKLVAHSATLRYFHCVKSSFEKWKSMRPDLPIYSLLSTSPETPYRTKSKSILQYTFKKKFKKGLVGLMSCVYNRIDYSLSQIKKYAEHRSLSLYQSSQMKFFKPFLKNLAHVHRKRLVEVFELWKSGMFEYEYEETVTTVSNQKKNFKVMMKPVVLLDYYDDCKSNKVLIRNLAHILHRKLNFYWNRWIKFKKVEVVNSNDTSLDLAMFKLPFARFEKLRMIVVCLLNVAEARKNLPRIVLTEWMQGASKKNLTIQKLKVIFQTQTSNKEVKKQAFTALQLCNKFQTEFTDMA